MLSKQWQRASCTSTVASSHVAVSTCLQGLFERHKLIVATQLCMAVLRSKGELQHQKFEFLLRGPKEMGVDNPLGDWVSEVVGDGGSNICYDWTSLLLTQQQCVYAW